MTNLTLSIDGMSCGHCVSNVRRALESLPVVHVQDVKVGTAQLHVADASPATLRPILAALADAGYPASVMPPAAVTNDAVSTTSGCGCGCGTSQTAATPLTRAHA